MNIRARLSRLESKTPPPPNIRPWKQIITHEEDPEEQVQATIARLHAQGFNVIHRRVVRPTAFVPR